MHYLGMLNTDLSNGTDALEGHGKKKKKKLPSQIRRSPDKGEFMDAL